MTFKQKAAALVAGTLISSGAFAVTIADSAVTAITTDAGGAITAVGGAMLGLAAIAIAFKWAKAAIFG